MHMDLNDEWIGWRLRGRYLISPGGQRISPERLRGLLFRDQLELRKAGFASRLKADRGTRARQSMPKIKVVIIDLGEYRVNGLAAS